MSGPAVALVVTGTWWSMTRSGGARVGFVLAALLLVLAIATPRLYQPIQQVLESFGRWVARVFTWILLGLVFVTVFLPARVIGRVGGWDPLKRRAPHGGSYWVRIRTDAQASGYDRLY